MALDCKLPLLTAHAALPICVISAEPAIKLPPVSMLTHIQHARHCQACASYLYMPVAMHCQQTVIVVL